MKDMQFAPFKPDVKTPIVLLCLGVFGFIGYLTQTPLSSYYVYIPYGQLLDAGISVALGVLVWSVFRLIEPRRHGQNWMIAELTIVPFVWLILLLALVVWFSHLQNGEIRFMDSI